MLIDQQIAIDHFTRTLIEEGIIDEIFVDDIYLEDELTITEGDTYYLHPEISPEDAHNKNIVWSSDDDEDDFVAPQRTPALARIFFCCFFRARVSVIELADVVAKLLVVALIVSCAYVVVVRFYFSFLSFWCETESNRSRPRLARQKQRRYERRK